jgi:hypothetical protein
MRGKDFVASALGMPPHHQESNGYAKRNHEPVAANGDGSKLEKGRCQGLFRWSEVG